MANGPAIGDVATPMAPPMTIPAAVLRVLESLCHDLHVQRINRHSASRRRREDEIAIGAVDDNLPGEPDPTPETLGVWDRLECCCLRVLCLSLKVPRCCPFTLGGGTAPRSARRPDRVSPRRRVLRPR